jgi:S1-C subfamily serine protease
MKKNLKRRFFAISLLFTFALSASNVKADVANAGLKLNQEELVALSKPSVVRIVDHIKGEATFKPFTLDLDKLTISPAAGEPKKIPVDDYMTGSGFLVSSDGYIMTNSHVISLTQLKSELISSVAQAAIMDASLFSVNADQEDSDPAKFEEYAKRIDDYLAKQATFDFKQDIVVLDPSSKKEKVLELVADGFPISVVSINENYDKDYMDVALIKINQTNLPALALGKSSFIKTGEKIGVFGFPTTAEFNDKNPLTSTFSQGVVSAIRDSENGEFSMIQTDAKISEGSSGGPLLNESGEVLGMITYQTNQLDGPTGDNFAFAMPIDVVIEGIKKFNVSNSEIRFESGNFNKNFSNGLNLLHDAKCKSALTAFEGAKNTNEKFSAGNSVASYEKKCQDMIASGQSIDTKWDKAKKLLVSFDDWMWGVIALVLVLFVIIGIKFFTMKRRIKKDEKEIIILEEELQENTQRDLQEMKEIKKIEKELDELRKK